MQGKLLKLHWKCVKGLKNYRFNFVEIQIWVIHNKTNWRTGVIGDSRWPKHHPKDHQVTYTQTNGHTQTHMDTDVVPLSHFALFVTFMYAKDTNFIFGMPQIYTCTDTQTYAHTDTCTYTQTYISTHADIHRHTCIFFIYTNTHTYVMCATWEGDVSPRWRYASEDVNPYSRNSAHGHQPKGGQSCADSA